MEQKQTSPLHRAPDPRPANPCPLVPADRPRAPLAAILMSLIAAIRFSLTSCGAALASMSACWSVARTMFSNFGDDHVRGNSDVQPGASGTDGGRLLKTLAGGSGQWKTGVERRVVSPGEVDVAVSSTSLGSVVPPTTTDEDPAEPGTPADTRHRPGVAYCLK